MTQSLLIATQNTHKLEEFRQLWPGCPLTDLSRHSSFIMPPETGDTFLANSVIKSTAVHEFTGSITLADDSGLVVDALDGAPGIRSARYVPGSDRDRYLALLKAMENKSVRTARFVACLSIIGLPQDITLPANVFRDKQVVYTFGEVLGAITSEPRGINGFGYDPIFELPDGRTMAEVSSAEKQRLSHRAMAAQNLRPLLNNYFS